MNKEEERNYVFAQLSSLPNAFQYVSVTNYIENLERENKQLKEIINKSLEYIRSNDIEVLKYHDIPSETTTYEIVTIDLLKILKEVE